MPEWGWSDPCLWCPGSYQGREIDKVAFNGKGWETLGELLGPWITQLPGNHKQGVIYTPSIWQPLQSHYPMPPNEPVTQGPRQRNKIYKMLSSAAEKVEFFGREGKQPGPLGISRSHSAIFPWAPGNPSTPPPPPLPNKPGQHRVYSGK